MTPFEHALDLLRQGGVVAIPTDTVYGLVARLPSSARLFELKARPRGVDLPVLVADLAQAETLVVSPVPLAAARLMERWWPGPLTVVLERRPGLEADLGESSATIGVRCPNHAVPRFLAAEVGPLASSSANRHGDRPATTASEAGAAFPDLVVVDGGQCSGLPSTVVACLGQDLRLLRAGALPFEEIVDALSG